MREHLGKTQVAIFGHSWGSALGVLYAARFPEKVAAYVGSGQIGDWAAGESASYEFALAEAQRVGNRRALRKLRTIGPPPHTADAVFTQRTWLARLEGRMAPRALWKVARAVLGSRESSIFELPSTMRGFRFSIDAMWPEVSRLNLIELVPELPMPVFFFLGRQDHWVPPQASVAYYEALTPCRSSSGLSTPATSRSWTSRPSSMPRSRSSFGHSSASRTTDSDGDRGEGRGVPRTLTIRSMRPASSRLVMGGLSRAGPLLLGG